MMTDGLSIVVPVYNGAATLPELLRRLANELPSISPAFEVILVDDGSRDETLDVLRRLRGQYAFVRVFCLLRNYGQHNALLCGIRRARHPVIVTMDDDLQHPPERIASLVGRLNQGYDLVYGFPEREQHGFWRDIASPLTKAVMRRVLGVDSATKVSGFRALRRSMTAALDDFKGPFVNLDVMFTWGTTKIDAVVMPLDPRVHGASNYGLWKLIEHTMNMLTGFSVLPLRVASLLGLALTFFGAVALVYVLGRYALQGSPVAGFPFLASVIIIFSGAQLFVLGVMGEYLARMHLRLLGRPAYAVAEELEATEPR